MKGFMDNQYELKVINSSSRSLGDRIVKSVDFVCVDLFFNLLIFIILTFSLWVLSFQTSIPMLISFSSFTGLDSIELVRRVQDYWLSFELTSPDISSSFALVFATIYVSMLRWFYQKARNGIVVFKVLINVICITTVILFVLDISIYGAIQETYGKFPFNIRTIALLTLPIFLPTLLSWFLSKNNGLAELLDIRNNIASFVRQLGFVGRYSYKNTESIKAITLFSIELLYGLLMIAPLVLTLAYFTMQALSFYFSDLRVFAGLTILLIPFMLLRLYQYSFRQRSFFKLLLPFFVIYCGYRVIAFFFLNGSGGIANVIPMDWLLVILLLITVRKLFLLVTRKLHQYSGEYISSVTKKIRRNADQLEAYYASPPLLLLRAFKDDMNVVRQKNRVISWLFGLDKEIVRLEELIVDLLSAEGPVVALSNPHLDEQPLGAARKEATDDTWQDDVHDYIDRAKWIVLVMGVTEHVNWEISQIIKKGMLGKLIVILPTSYSKHVSIAKTSTKLAELMGFETISQESEMLKNVTVIHFEESQKRFVAYESKNKHASDYLRHLNQVLFASS